MSHYKYIYEFLEYLYIYKLIIYYFLFFYFFNINKYYKNNIF